MQARSFFVALSSLSLLALAGCGKEIGRIPFTGSGSGSATLTLQAGDVDFWTDIDASYEGSASALYHVTLEQGGVGVGAATCYPLGQINVKTTWTETNLGSSHSRSGMGKMPCSLKLAKAGPTFVKVSFNASANKPATVTIKKADLVVKQ